jgi:hypothetical protein
VSITIKTHANHISVRFPSGPKWSSRLDACKSIPHGWWNVDERAWCYPKTEASEIAERFMGQEVYTDHEFDELVKRETSMQASDDYAPQEQPPLVRTPLWSHQLRSFWKMAELFGDTEVIRGSA